MKQETPTGEDIDIKRTQMRCTNSFIRPRPYPLLTSKVKSHSTNYHMQEDGIPHLIPSSSLTVPTITLSTQFIKPATLTSLAYIFKYIYIKQTYIKIFFKKNLTRVVKGDHFNSTKCIPKQFLPSAQINKLLRVLAYMHIHVEKYKMRKC